MPMKKVKTRICETAVRVTAADNTVRFTSRQEAKQLYFICCVLNALGTLYEPLEVVFDCRN